jgi:hypothetical protein
MAATRTGDTIRPAHLDKDNAEDKVTKGRHRWAPGTRQPHAKLTDDAVREIRRRYAVGDIRQIDLAAEYGVAQTLIGRVVTRKIWKHVT